MILKAKNNIHCMKQNTSLSLNHTSIEVETFFSLILSYFCFLVPAFNPCQGRLQKYQIRNNRQLKDIRKPNKRCERLITFLLKNT